LNTFIFKVFLLNLVVVGAIYLLSRRFFLASKKQKHTLLICFLLSPVVLAVKGAMSALYVSDLLSLVLLWYALQLYPVLPQSSKGLLLRLLTILVALPLLGTFVNYLVYGAVFIQFSSQGMEWLSIWMWRNLIYLSVFVIATSRPVSMEVFISQLKAVLILGFGTALIGLVDYSGVKDLSVYEMISAYNSPYSAYHSTKTTIGWGFLGMFRGSVGQLYANLYCVCIPFIIVMRGRWQWFSILMAIICVVLVFCSLSRAGMVGILLAGVLMTALSGFKGSKMLVFMCVVSVVLSPLLQLEIFQERIESIATYASSSELNRVDGWFLSIEAFKNDILLLVFGNGAANRVGVAQIMGSYGAHNEYVDVIFRGGGLTFAALLIFLKKFLLQLMKKRNKVINGNERIWLSVVPAILIMNMVIAVTQDHLFRDYSGYVSGLLMYYLYGLGIAVIPTRKIRSRLLEQSFQA
jgi:hypothetical protein